MHVNAIADLEQRFPAVAVGADGRVLVVWVSEIDQRLAGGVRAKVVRGRLLGPDGAPTGGDLTLSSPGGHWSPANPLVAARSGGFLLVWDWGQSALPLDASGAPAGDLHSLGEAADLTYQLVTPPAGEPVAVLADLKWSYVCPWPCGAPFDLALQPLTAGGELAGAATTVALSFDLFGFPAAAAHPAGPILLAWREAGLRAGWFGADGAALGEPVELPVPTAHTFATVATNGRGDALAGTVVQKRESGTVLFRSELHLQAFLVDGDGDGTADESDVCPAVADDQSDGDGDGIGAACDCDDADSLNLALCLGASGRFRVSAVWSTAAADGPAHAIPLTADTGAFWFFQPGNVELLVKVLDACAAYDRFWVFASGLTDVGVTLTVEDDWTGARHEYRHTRGTLFAPLADTSTFDVCATAEGHATHTALTLTSSRMPAPASSRP
jgi:hypothetical protein